MIYYYCYCDNSTGQAIVAVARCRIIAMMDNPLLAGRKKLPLVTILVMVNHTIIWLRTSWMSER